MTARLPALIAILLIALCPHNLFSHPGRTDANGGTTTATTVATTTIIAEHVRAARPPRPMARPRQAAALPVHPLLRGRHRRVRSGTFGIV
jgi:hypothetical protein